MDESNNEYGVDFAQYVFDLFDSVQSENNKLIFEKAASELGLSTDQAISMFITQKISEKFIISPRGLLKSVKRPTNYYFRSLRNDHGKFRVFISYRRLDSLNIAERVLDHLITEFGDSVIFKDTDSISSGDQFSELSKEILIHCTVVLVILGPKWLSESEESNLNKAFDIGDFVRQEIEIALENKLPIIPVMVNGAAMPKKDQVPA